jgi:hypothetical protein
MKAHLLQPLLAAPPLIEVQPSGIDLVPEVNLDLRKFILDGYGLDLGCNKLELVMVLI